MNIEKLITPLKAQIVRKLNPHDLKNLCLVDRKYNAEFCENRKFWEYLLRTEFYNVPIPNINLVQYYYYHRTSAVALGSNNESQLGGKDEVKQWKTIMFTVRSVVMTQNTSALITVDNDLYVSGTATFRGKNLIQPTWIMSNVKQVYIDVNGDFMYVLKTSSDLFLYYDTKLTFLVSGIVRIDGQNWMFYGANSIYWRASWVEPDNDPYTFETLELEMSHEYVNERIRKIIIKIRGEIQKTVKYLSRLYLLTMNKELYDLKTKQMIANNVSTCGEFYGEASKKYIYWIDTEFAFNFKTQGDDLIKKITFDRAIIDFRSDRGLTYYLLTDDSELYIAGTADEIFRQHVNLPPPNFNAVPLETITNSVLLMKNVLSFDVANDNIICVVYPD